MCQEESGFQELAVLDAVLAFIATLRLMRASSVPVL